MNVSPLVSLSYRLLFVIARWRVVEVPDGREALVPAPRGPAQQRHEGLAAAIQGGRQPLPLPRCARGVPISEKALRR